MEESSNSDFWKPGNALALILSVLLPIAIILFIAPTALRSYEYLLPILIGLVAFPAMIFTIIYASRVAHSLGVASQQHAFGMPPGSVRAILAISFVVLVLIFGVYTMAKVSGSANWKVVTTLDVPKDQNSFEFYKSLLSDFPKEYYLELDRVKDDKGGIITVKKQIDDPMVAQIAQQVLTMLATALTAIVGFYFGSRASSEPDLSALLRGSIKEDKISKFAQRVNAIRDAITVNGGIKTIRDFISQPYYSKRNIEVTRRRLKAFDLWQAKISDVESQLKAIRELASYKADPSSVDQVKLDQLDKLVGNIEENWSYVVSFLKTENISEVDKMTV